MRQAALAAGLALLVGAPAFTSIIELGAKSAGFVPGEPLGASVIVRAGVGLPFARR